MITASHSYQRFPHLIPSYNPPLLRELVDTTPHPLDDICPFAPRWHACLHPWHLQRRPKSMLQKLLHEWKVTTFDKHLQWFTVRFDVFFQLESLILRFNVPFSTIPKDPWSLKNPSQPQALDVIPHIIACKVTGPWISRWFFGVFLGGKKLWEKCVEKCMKIIKCMGFF